MNGTLGKEGWAWIFMLEGFATIVVGLVSFWMIHDFPSGAEFLTEAERTVIIRRLQEDSQHSAAGEKFEMKHIWQSLSDWRTYLTSEEFLPPQTFLIEVPVSVLMYAGTNGPLYAFSLFLPTIINEVSRRRLFCLGADIHT